MDAFAVDSYFNSTLQSSFSFVTELFDF